MISDSALETRAEVDEAIRWAYATWLRPRPDFCLPDKPIMDYVTPSHFVLGDTAPFELIFHGERGGTEVLYTCDGHDLVFHWMRYEGHQMVSRAVYQQLGAGDFRATVCLALGRLMGALHPPWDARAQTLIRAGFADDPLKRPVPNEQTMRTAPRADLTSFGLDNAQPAAP